MRTKFEIRNPDEIEASLTVTMTVKQFRQLRAQIGHEWPSWDFARAIGDVIRQAESTFYANSDIDTEAGL